MKFDWGTGLAMAIVIFMGGTIGFVSFALTQEFDLVEEHYYEKSIAYQEQIERSNRTEALKQPLRYKLENRTLTITLPLRFEEQEVEGRLHFYRPDDKNLDKKRATQFNENLSQTIMLNDYKAGKWRLKINFTADGRSYYDEYEFFIP